MYKALIILFKNIYRHTRGCNYFSKSSLQRLFSTVYKNSNMRIKKKNQR